MISNLWPDVPTINSCDAGYQICSILSALGRVGILSEWAFITSGGRLTDHHPATSLFPLLIPAVLGARTYALFNKSKIILVIFGSLGLAVIAVAAVRIGPYLCSSA